MTETADILHDVLARLDALEQRNDALEADNAILKQQNPVFLADADRRPASDDMIDDLSGSSLERMSRRWVLRRGMQAAAATVVAGGMLRGTIQESDANHSTVRVEANSVVAHYLDISGEIYAQGNFSGALIRALNTNEGPNCEGVHGTAFDGIGVGGYGLTGVRGVSPSRNGVVGESQHIDASGVYGLNTTNGYGVAGDTTSPASTDVFVARAGVFGRNNGAGAGVFGVSVNSDGDGVLGIGKVGVHGTSSVANSSAVFGQGAGSAHGVKASSVNGYGAVVSGGRAPLRLVPRTVTGKPTTGVHQIGELSLDKVGTLFICTAAGTPGTWRMVTTALA